MTVRYTRGLYRGMTPCQRQDSEEFGDWPDDESLPVILVEREDHGESATMNACQMRRARAYIESRKFTWPGEAEEKGGN